MTELHESLDFRMALSGIAKMRALRRVPLFALSIVEKGKKREYFVDGKRIGAACYYSVDKFLFRDSARREVALIKQRKRLERVRATQEAVYGKGWQGRFDADHAAGKYRNLGEG